MFNILDYEHKGFAEKDSLKVLLQQIVIITNLTHIIFINFDNNNNNTTIIVISMITMFQVTFINH